MPIPKTKELSFHFNLNINHFNLYFQQRYRVLKFLLGDDEDNRDPCYWLFKHKNDLQQILENKSKLVWLGDFALWLKFFLSYEVSTHEYDEKAYLALQTVIHKYPDFPPYKWVSLIVKYNAIKDARFLVEKRLSAIEQLKLEVGSLKEMDEFRLINELKNEQILSLEADIKAYMPSVRSPLSRWERLKAYLRLKDVASENFKAIN